MLRPVIALVCATCVLLAGSAAGAKRASTPCGPAGARTLAVDRTARVYSRHGNVYGCAQGSPKSYKLGTAQNSMSEDRAGPIALAGNDAAYGLTSYGVDMVSAQVLVRRLSDGKVLRQEDSISGSVGPESFETVDDIVVKSDGSVAWIAHASWLGHGPGPHSVTEVEKSDQTHQRLLDRSDRIRTGSLRLRRSRLTWRDGSAKKSATLQ